MLAWLRGSGSALKPIRIHNTATVLPILQILLRIIERNLDVTYQYLETDCPGWNLNLAQPGQ